MKPLDNLVLAWRTVRANKLRTGITVAIIAFGIMALVGIFTAIEAMNDSLRDSFSTMGANAFSIRYKERKIGFGNEAQVSKSNTKNQRRVRKSNTGKSLPSTRRNCSSSFTTILLLSASVSMAQGIWWSILKTKKPIQQ